MDMSRRSPGLLSVYSQRAPKASSCTWLSTNRSGIATSLRTWASSLQSTPLSLHQEKDNQWCAWRQHFFKTASSACDDGHYGSLDCWMLDKTCYKSDKCSHWWWGAWLQSAQKPAAWTWKWNHRSGNPKLLFQVCSGCSQWPPGNLNRKPNKAFHDFICKLKPFSSCVIVYEH